MNNCSGYAVYLGGHAYSLNGYFSGENMYRAWVQNDRGETKLLHIYNFAKFQPQLPDAGNALLTKLEAWSDQYDFFPRIISSGWLPHSEEVVLQKDRCHIEVMHKPRLSGGQWQETACCDQAWPYVLMDVPSDRVSDLSWCGDDKQLPWSKQDKDKMLLHIATAILNMHQNKLIHRGINLHQMYFSKADCAVPITLGFPDWTYFLPVEVGAQIRRDIEISMVSASWAQKLADDVHPRWYRWDSSTQDSNFLMEPSVSEDLYGFCCLVYALQHQNGDVRGLYCKNPRYFEDYQALVKMLGFPHFEKCNWDSMQEVVDFLKPRPKKRFLLF